MAAVAVITSGCTAASRIGRALAGLPWQLLRGYLRVVAAGLAPRSGPVHGRLHRGGGLRRGRVVTIGATLVLTMT